MIPRIHENSDAALIAAPEQPVVSREWAVGEIHDAIADAVPDRLMAVCGERRTTFGESRSRTTRFANFLAGQGFGVTRARRDLQRWECGQDRIALVMHNDHYPDVMIGCMKARTIPVNINHHYTPGEIRQLLDKVGARGIVYHRSLGALVHAAVPDGADLLVCVDDGSAEPELPGCVAYQDALEAGSPVSAIATSPDDLLMICTGGTTGRPKGVLWRQADIYVSAMQGKSYDSVDEVGPVAEKCSGAFFAVSPLMHAAGIWTAFSAIMNARTIVLADNRGPFDPRVVLRVAEREKVNLMSIVGDAYAAPLAAELGNTDYDLSSLAAIGTGGAATNSRYKQAILDRLPHIAIIDGYGSSETGGMGYGATTRGAAPTTFAPEPGGRVVSADRSRFLEPGETELGWAARTGRVPLGYLGDRAATETTFPVIDGARVAIPGDRARLEPDGTITVVGRDALVVNTGGEKVFVEEVEEVLRRHPDIGDAVVVGRPSDRWGQELVTVLAVRAGTELTDDDLYDHCVRFLPGFKVPKAVRRVGVVQRLANGKGDYRWAAEQGAHAIPLARARSPLTTRQSK